MEGEYIRKYRPVLNTQIPKADNWRSYDVGVYVSCEKAGQQPAFSLKRRTPWLERGCF